MRKQTLDDILNAHPGFFVAVAEDARATLKFCSEPHKFTNRWIFIYHILRLMWVSDAFLAQVAYRGKARLQYYRVPLLPTLLHKFAMMHSQVCIGNPVIIEPGVYFPHGQVVIDGVTQIESNVVIFPWVTIGLKASNFHGPIIRQGAHIGTGAKVLGEIEIGSNARIGANAVVVKNVSNAETVVGIPAQAINHKSQD